MGDKYPILFVSSNLGGGGAERALMDIINHLDRSCFTPHLALYQKEGIFLEHLSEDIPVYEIQPQDRGFLARNWCRSRALHDLCKNIQPTLVMSIKWQVNQAVLLSLKPWKHNLPVIINEQEPPRISADPKRRKMWPIVKRFYSWADHVIVITQGIADELERNSGIARKKISVIHNPVDFSRITGPLQQEIPRLTSDMPLIVSMGRLAPVKNYPLLLKAHALILEHRPVMLHILGEGPERNKLESLTNTLSISAYVRFLGFQSNPYPYLAQADIFALTSQYEGFGNVIIEALASGIPVVSTNCPYGPGEILAGGKYGKLVPVDDERTLAKTILDLLANPEEQQHLSTIGLARAREFSIEKIIQQYEAIFHKVIKTEPEA